MPLLIVILSVAALATGLAGVYWGVRERTRIEWHGRSILLVHRMFHDEVWVDGVRAAWGAASDRLDGRFHDPALGEVPIVWVRAPDGRFGVYVAGEPVAGDHHDDAARRASALPEPADPRWPAARALLESLGGSADPTIRDATRQIGAGLRDALRHLGILADTAAAHTALGGDADLATARKALDEEVDRWIAALRSLHLHSAVKAASAEDVLAKVRAESEVDGAVRRRARELAARVGERNRS
jgi:hypothetical protein